MAGVLPTTTSPTPARARAPWGRDRLAVGLTLTCYLLAAVAVTWHLWADPASRTIAGNPNDADLFAWFLRYDASAIMHGRLPALVTTAMNAPQGINVMWNTAMPLPGVLLTPVTLVLGPQTALTVLTTVGFAGSAASMFLVLRRWEASTGAAALAGAVYGFSPALLHASVGHYNTQLAVLPPLIIDAGLRLCLRSRAPVRDGLVLGLLATAQIFTGEELLLLTAIAGVVLVAVLALGRPRAAAERWRPAVAGLAVATAITLLLAGYPLWVQFFGPLAQHGSAFTPDFFENDLTGFVTPSRYLLLHTAASAAAAARYQGGVPEYLAFLGWPLIATLAVGTLMFWRRPAVRATAVTLVVLELLSLGGHPLVNGVFHADVSLPWRWIEAVPVLGSALPDRLSVIADGAAAALLAFCYDLARAKLAASIKSGDPGAAGWRAGYPGRVATVLVTAGAVIACLPLVPLPLPAATASPLPAGWSAVFAALRLPAGARVLVVPVPTATLTDALRWQADTGEPASLIGGYFTGPATGGQAYVDGNGPAATAKYLDGLSSGPVIAAPAPSQVRADLDAWRPAAVVAVTSPSSPLGLYLARLFGPPRLHSGHVLAWRLSRKLPISRIVRRTLAPIPAPGGVTLALRIIVGLALTAIAAAIAGRRLWWLDRLGRSGQPAPERIAYVREHPARDAGTELTEVLGQRKLLKWSVPGTAHFLTFWGFILLVLTIIESYGDLFSRTFAIPGIGHWAWVGFLEDLVAVGVLVGIGTFAVIRLRAEPKREGRKSRFAGSHTRAAWLVLGMIFLVIATLLIYRGAQINTGVFPYRHDAFASQIVGHWLHPLGKGVNSVLEAVFILAQIGVITAFTVVIVYSKHLHIALAPLNVLFSRRPNGLGALQPMRSGGKVLDFEEADPDTDVFGLGKIEDFTWKGMLDMATCTECGRCQSQCPAWATGKPLSPKMLILDLRDHAFAKAPYLLAGSDEAREKLPDSVKAEAERPLVGDSSANGVIDPDVLWSCTNCGACVEECPVDIEHIDHIAGLRRHQVLIESAFPTEASSMLKNLENKGDPWGMGAARRLEWAEGLDFEVPVADGPIGEDVEYLFWVGCAGALEDRARKTTRAIAELLHTAGVSFAVLGPAETCTGDPARRIGNEFVFSMLAQQNIETLNEAGARTIVASCPHCFNALANEYPQLGGNYEVIHHTQLLARLVSEGRLTPVAPVSEKITYHDPCFLGRHNRIFTAPREIMEHVPGVRAQEMHRCKERGFCCGAGGARMWMEERIGKRINTERIDEALGTNPDTISTGCPYCLVMLGDAISAKKASGEAKESLEVVDVAQLLARSVRAPAAVAAVGPGAAEQPGSDGVDGAPGSSQVADPGAPTPGSTGPDPG